MTTEVETLDSVDEFLAHVGVKGMKWGKRKAVSTSSEPKAPKKVSAGKQRDLETKAARARLNEGKNVVQKLLNADSFGKPLGGRQMLSLMNKGSSQEDVALAARMTRGQKAALATVVGAGILLNAVSRR